MQLRIDEQGLIRDLMVALNREMDSVCQVLLELMIGEISAIPSSGSESVGKPDWRLDVIQALKFQSVATANQLVKEVGLINQTDMGTVFKAMLIEFGMGTQADNEDNPWIGEYLSSQYYHDRSGMMVSTHPEGDVYDPDSDSWRQSSAETRYDIPQFSQKGSLFWTNVFGNSAIMASEYFDAAIERAVDSVDFSEYLIVKG